MRVYINGKETDVAERQTVAELVTGKGLKPNAIVVEHNMVILPHEEWEQLALAADDNLEIIAFVGGG